MARPGQAAMRRKRAREEMEASPSTSTANGQQDPHTTYDYNDNDDTTVDGAQVQGHDQGNRENPRLQCLPVGILPEDFDGTPLDGSQYLAMANRDNADLPFAKRVSNPYKADTFSRNGHASASTMIGTITSTSSGSSSRHPALPKESWETVFPIHFQGYRKHIRSQLISSSSHSLPYPEDYPPLPRPSVRSEWYTLINGYLPSTKSKKGKEKAKPTPILTEEEALNIALGGETNVEMDQEQVEAEVIEEEVIKKTSRGNEKRVGKPREPLLSVIRDLTSSQALTVLSHFSLWITESLEQSPPPLPESPELLPTEPRPRDRVITKQSREAKVFSPLCANYFNWIFSLLLLVDEQLLSDDISTLRELARAVMKVAGHRWITGVVGKDIGENWVLGSDWKDQNEPQKQPDSTMQVNTNDESTNNDNRVDEVLARSWMIVHAIAAGWGQKDLLMELESLFA
ncbi:uncharacterized protein I303_102572 [Kwoniella dejecticola CBS 10117]|uniref:Uncharacterized protein n=1 Tax=Kwoniella dejecticola CBS 10117 TaxID=1296121 RepID=A0A1A6A944_9TREE|nr:uncharacterized protein I303_02586 [Kwoniella dejecticola CBS 10117]OBR86578.1 hypothetical protein I303_02586 [Kwoniella dejecticola CBS 10117]